MTRRPMSDAYAAAGVDTAQADRGVDALVGVLRTIELDRPSASVLRQRPLRERPARGADNLGIAMSTDGVGSKIVVAEQADRLETVGIDCIAMNVNDVVCVGAEPIAMLDYLAVEQADPDALARIARGPAGRRAGGEHRDPRRRARRAARAHPRPPVAARLRPVRHRVGTVALDAIVTGDDAAPGDALVGLPSSGLHSNGYTLARRALLDEGGLALDDRPPELGGAQRRRRPARADGHLRPRRARPPALGRPRPRPRAHHRRRRAQPPAPRRRADRLRDRGAAARAAASSALVARLGAVSRRRDVGGLQHGLRLRRGRPRRACGRGGRAARGAPSGRGADRQRHGRRGPRHRGRRDRVGRPRRSPGTTARACPERGRDGRERARAQLAHAADRRERGQARAAEVRGARGRPPSARGRPRRRCARTPRSCRPTRGDGGPRSTGRTRPRRRRRPRTAPRSVRAASAAPHVHEPDPEVLPEVDARAVRPLDEVRERRVGRGDPVARGCASGRGRSGSVHIAAVAAGPSATISRTARLRVRAVVPARP